MFRTADPFRDFAPADVSDYDIIRHDNGVEVHLDIPGIDPDHVDVTVDGRSLVVSADRPSTIPGTVVGGRRRSRTLRRRFHLGEKLDADALEADYALGVLTIRIPVAESAKPRKVTVGVGVATPTAHLDEGSGESSAAS